MKECHSQAFIPAVMITNHNEFTELVKIRHKSAQNARLLGCFLMGPITECYICALEPLNYGELRHAQGLILKHA